VTIFPLDREGPVPDFYVLQNTQEVRVLGEPGQYVLAATGEHPAKGWLMLGVVSAQTPFGQGGNAGVRKTDVRKATPDEIRHALRNRHPIVNGPYIPNRSGALDAKSLRRWHDIALRQAFAVLNSL
jgi:hypothetical protein